MRSVASARSSRGSMAPRRNRPSTWWAPSTRPWRLPRVRPPARDTLAEKKKLHVDIVTVEGRRFKGDADFVVAPGLEGEMGILPQHIPLLTTLKPGTVKVRNDGDELFFLVSGGFLEVRPDEVTVRSDSTERAEDIDES